LAELHAFLDRADIERVAVDVRRAKMAVEAFRRFGKGQHRAALNIGRLLAHALAKATGEKLLFKGDDFSQTDVVPIVI
jgi:ribonuclease VapC